MRTLMRRHQALVLATVLASSITARADEPAPHYERRWFYAMMNLQVKEQADRLTDGRFVLDEEQAGDDVRGHGVEGSGGRHGLRPHPPR